MIPAVAPPTGRLICACSTESIQAGGTEHLNPFDLTGRVAIVTGGNGGIGLGMARGLAAAGAAIAIAARNEAKSNDAVAELRKHGAKAISVVTDVTDETAVAAMVERV